MRWTPWMAGCWMEGSSEFKWLAMEGLHHPIGGTVVAEVGAVEGAAPGHIVGLSVEADLAQTAKAPEDGQDRFPRMKRKGLSHSANLVQDLGLRCCGR